MTCSVEGCLRSRLRASGGEMPCPEFRRGFPFGRVPRSPPPRSETAELHRFEELLFAADRPDEPGELASHGGDGLVGVLAACEELDIAPAEPRLRAPGDALNTVGDTSAALAKRGAQRRAVAIRPGRSEERRVGKESR